MPGLTVGCISYKKIGPNTVEMNRLTVDTGKYKYANEGFPNGYYKPNRSSGSKIHFSWCITDSFLDFRGMKIGKKLLHALIDCARQNGYEEMYLETSAPYGIKFDAMYLYEKMGFKYLRSFDFDWPYYCFAWCTSLKIMSYIHRIQ